MDLPIAEVRVTNDKTHKDLIDLFFMKSKKQAKTQGTYAKAKILFKCPAFTNPKL